MWWFWLNVPLAVAFFGGLVRNPARDGHAEPGLSEV
jgi:hypothetical protein